jgi:hypothetical protein
MLVLIRPRAAWLLAVAAVMTAALLSPATLSPATIARAVSAGSGSCYPVSLTWICVYSGSAGGDQGSGGGSGRSSTITCTYTKAPPGVLQRTGTGPPAPGYQWDVMTCPGSRREPAGGRLVQVSTSRGNPAISPVYLLEIGVGALSVPTLTAATAPPLGADGLVGLPEWYWVPRSEWHPVSMTVRAGPVWAIATAVPTMLSYIPGDGLGSVSCPGPGSSFNRALPASRQQTRCSYTYARPSKGQPGDVFQAGLFVSWTIRWTGSGGAGGLITTNYTTGSAVTVRIAQAEALVTTP